MVIAVARSTCSPPPIGSASESEITGQTLLTPGTPCNLAASDAEAVIESPFQRSPNAKRSLYDRPFALAEVRNASFDAAAAAALPPSAVDGVVRSTNQLLGVSLSVAAIVPTSTVSSANAGSAVAST